MKKNSTYMERALKSRDPRYARILGKLNYERRDMVAEDPNVTQPATEEETLEAVRTRYKEVIGRAPYYGWDIDTLKRKIEEAGN